MLESTAKTKHDNRNKTLGEVNKMEITKKQLLRKIKRQCHVCGSGNILGCHVGTNTFFCFCFKHRAKVLNLNADEPYTIIE